MDMDSNGDDQDSEDAEEEDAVDEDGDAAGGHVAELHHPRARRQLEEKAWGEEDEEDGGDDDGPPVGRHSSVSAWVSSQVESSCVSL